MRGFVIDTVLGAILRMIETAVGQVPPDLRIELPLATPAWREQYQRFGVADVRFDRPAFAFHFAQRDLALPCIGADAKAHASACRECEEALAEVAGAEHGAARGRAARERATTAPIRAWPTSPRAAASRRAR